MSNEMHNTIDDNVNKKIQMKLSIIYFSRIGKKYSVGKIRK